MEKKVNVSLYNIIRMAEQHVSQEYRDAVEERADYEERYPEDDCNPYEDDVVEKLKTIKQLLQMEKEIKEGKKLTFVKPGKEYTGEINYTVGWED